jgi:histone-lysine N-methyltransferase SETMAR
MNNFVPSNMHLREVLLHYFILKKTAAESHRLLVEAYSDHALSETTCRDWFRRFKSGDFDLDNKERGKPPKKFEDSELQSLLDEDDAQSQEQLAEELNVDQATISRRLQALGKIRKEGKWVPHELKERDIERRLVTCEMLLNRFERKSFLHRIVTGDEKWIYFDNPVRTTHYVDPGAPVKSTPKRNIHGNKVLLSIWWDQIGVVYYELLKPKETIDGPLYRLQLFRLRKALEEKRPEYAERHDKIILQHDNARPHVCKVVQTALKTIGWEVLSHPPYSPDLAPSDYYLFRSMSHGLADQHFSNYEEVKKWLDDWIASKPEKFYWDGIHKLPKNWQKVVENNGNYIQ